MAAAEVPQEISFDSEGVAEGNTCKSGDEPLHNDAVVVTVVHNHLQGQLLCGACFVEELLSGGRGLVAGPVQDEGEGPVGL